MNTIHDSVAQLVDDRFCESCGYNLRGLHSDRCPECGTQFNPGAIPVAKIPWLRRSELGAWRAYWQTVFAATFHPMQFARETAKPGAICADDADRFRRVIICQSAATAALFPASFILINTPRNLILVIVAAALSAAAIGIATAVFFCLGTANLPLAGYELWDVPRARVLNSYRCAPLALLPLTVISPFLLLAIARGTPLLELAVWLFYGGLGAIFILILSNSIIMLCAPRGYSARAIAEVAILVPIMWTWAAIASGCVGLLTAGVAGAVFDLVVRTFS